MVKLNGVFPCCPPHVSLLIKTGIWGSWQISKWKISLFLRLVSGCGICDQSSGADPHQDAVPETIVPRADGHHPLRSADRGLAVPVEGFGAHPPTGCALLSHVLVQLWEGQEMAVWGAKHQRAHNHHQLHIWSSVWLSKSVHTTWLKVKWNFRLMY